MHRRVVGHPAPLFLALSLLFTLEAHAAGPLTSGVIHTGSIAAPGGSESWTFPGTIGQRVVFSAVTTGGAMNTNVVLRDPGNNVQLNTSLDRNDFQLTSTGTWTVVVSDFGDNDTGSYSLSFLNLATGPFTTAGDLDGGSIASNEIKAGTCGAAGDFDVFTFSGAVGQRVVVGCLSTAGGSYNTQVALYPPGGGAAEFYSSSDRNEAVLLQSGTYTLVLEDVGMDHTGSYSLALLNLSVGPFNTAGDADGGAIASAAITNANVTGAMDLDAYTFNGVTGQRVVFGAIATGGGLNTNVSLYPPGGGAAVLNTSIDRNDFELTANGTWTLVVEDFGNDAAGSYALSLLLLGSGPLKGPFDTEAITYTGSNEPRFGTLDAAGDFDVYTFSGSAGDRVLIGALPGLGSLVNTQVALYPPNGGAAELYGSSDRNEVQLLQTGTYTLVMEDVGLDQAGGYVLTLLNLTAGPLNTGGDPDGGALASSEPRTGGFATAGDFDAYTFSGSFGQRVVFGAVATGAGTHNTNLALYPPGGGAAVLSTSVDRSDYQLTATGTWTLVVEDFGDNDTGGYTVSMVNLATGPFAGAAEPAAAILASNGTATGTIGGVADFDPVFFPGTAGDRVLLGAYVTSGASFNTQIAVYPPNGGAAEVYSSADRNEIQLLQSGTYTLVMEDVGLDHAGDYLLSFLNLTAGPLTSIGDPDGGPLVSAVPRSGTLGTVADFDAYTFSGTFGQRVILGAVATGAGTHNTNFMLYPPGGGAAVVNTSIDRSDYQLTASGTWTVVVEDFGDNDTGAYVVSMLNVTAGPLTSGSDSDGGTVASNEVRSGSIGTVGDFDAFSFTATAGDRLVFGLMPTGGASFNTQIALYPPGGGGAELYGSGDLQDATLLQSGTYTVVMEDVGLDHTGNYSLSYVNLAAGPYVSGGDPDGGSIGLGSLRNGAISTVPDFDVYYFYGGAGDTVTITCVTLSGAMNTNCVLYPPAGAAVVNSSIDNFSHVLASSGRYTLRVEDFGTDQTGTYQLQLGGTIFSTAVPDAEGPRAPERVELAAPYPNPFRGRATLAYALPARAPVRLTLYDVRGARVRTLVDGAVEAGRHREVWDGRDERGHPAGPGLYWAELRAGAAVVRRRLVRVE